MMKGVLILYSENQEELDLEKVYNNQNSYELSENWAKSICESNKIENLDSYYKISAENLSDLLGKIAELCDKNQFDTVVFGFSNCPFYNTEITQKLFNFHIEYKSEYTFADGYPLGFAPEVIHAGTVKILHQLSITSEEKLGASKVTKESLFNLLKTDINSFEVETLMAPEDWRLLRLCFDTSKKENFLACQALAKACNNKIEEDINKLSDIAANTLDVLKTVPGFYNIQISDAICSEVIYSPYKNCFEKLNKLAPVNLSKQSAKDFNVMQFDCFSKLIDKIADYSQKAVISLSAFGEAFSNPDLLKMIEKILSFEGLSVFIETDGVLVTEEFCSELKKIIDSAKKRTNGWEKVMIAVCIDSFTSQTYKKIHLNGDEQGFEKSVNAIKALYSVIPGSVYPQFTRMNENEEELESFFRYWKESSNASGGNLIIQKYDDFAGLLPQCKPADLSPIDRNPCWHLRRDITILTNGDVPKCRQCVNTEIIGNVFSDDLDSIWKKTDELLKTHMEKNYQGKCSLCDEFYTYNF